MNHRDTEQPGSLTPSREEEAKKNQPQSLAQSAQSSSPESDEGSREDRRGRGLKRFASSKSRRFG